MVKALWHYRARLERVVDGDTIEVFIDQGFHGFRHERLRLLGVDTPEMTGTTKEAGKTAKSYTASWLTAAGSDEWPLVIQTAKTDAFGRFLATVWRVTDGRCLNEDLLADSQAVTLSG